MFKNVPLTIIIDSKEYPYSSVSVTQSLRDICDQASISLDPKHWAERPVEEFEVQIIRQSTGFVLFDGYADRFKLSKSLGQESYSMLCRSKAKVLVDSSADAKVYSAGSPAQTVMRNLMRFAVSEGLLTLDWQAGAWNLDEAFSSTGGSPVYKSMTDLAKIGGLIIREKTGGEIFVGLPSTIGVNRGSFDPMRGKDVLDFEANPDLSLLHDTYKVKTLQGEVLVRNPNPALRLRRPWIEFSTGTLKKNTAREFLKRKVAFDTAQPDSFRVTLQGLDTFGEDFRVGDKYTVKLFGAQKEQIAERIERSWSQDGVVSMIDFAPTEAYEDPKYTTEETNA